MPDHNRRSSDSFFTKYVVPALVGLAASASVGAFTLVWNLSTKVALIEQRQWVRIEEFVQTKTELAQTQKDLERLREWMKNHAQRAGQEAYPAASYSYGAQPVVPAPAATPPPPPQ